MVAIEKKTLNVGKFVTTQHVDSVIRNYKQERWVQNSERLGKEDSLSAWWSIEELENFLDTAKINGADGVKFYFGAYAKDYAEKPEYAGLQTLAMVATKQKESANGGTTNKDVYINGENGNTILGYNTARLCPPSCGPLQPTVMPDWWPFDEATISINTEVGVTLIDNGDNGMMVI